MIRRFSVKGLRHKANFTFDVNAHLNIFTGKNGIGKTTLLKFIWYMFSGNLRPLFLEIDFEEAELITDGFRVFIRNSEMGDERGVRQAHLVFEGNNIAKWERTIRYRNGELLMASRDLSSELCSLIGMTLENSVFFPTFRRIEGGFMMNYGMGMGYGRRRGFEDIGDSLEELSSMLSSKNHRFVASVSTDDIKKLLTTEYANVSENTNTMYRRFSEFINQRVSEENDGELMSNDSAVKLMGEIKDRLKQVNGARNSLLQPFDTLSNLILEIIKDKKISVSQTLTFGKAKEVISSDILSAGEKQMLSFLSYNAFAKNAVIFIDEPELSLHVDWQRILFTKLLEQGSSNQFIVTTHSPFIYSKYPECEIQLCEDRGE